MNRNSFLAATASLPLFILLAGCAPMHDTRQSLTQQTPSSHVDSSLPAALKNGWPDSQWWKAYHDAQLDALIDNAIQHSPDMQVAEQRIQLAEAQAKAVEAQDGPQLDFSADIERQRMSAEGLMAIRDYRPCGGNDRAVVYQRYIRPDGGLGSGFMGEKPR